MRRNSRQTWCWMLCAAWLACSANAQDRFTPGAIENGQSPAELFASCEPWRTDIGAVAHQESLSPPPGSYADIPLPNPGATWPGSANAMAGSGSGQHHFDAGHGYGGPNLAPICDDCPSHGLYGFFGYDSWKTIADGGWSSNGLHTGVNWGTRLGSFSDWTGIGFQLGGSVGVYNWSGTDYHIARQDQATTQGFVTGGFFRKPTEGSPWTFGLVQDWMITSNYGIFAENPTLSQWRGQLGYALGPWYEVGVWAAWRGQGDSRQVLGFGTVAWRPVEQFNFYTRYKWDLEGTDTWFWIGLPEEDRLAGNGSLGDYTVGVLANVPLRERLALYSLVTYMHPSARPGPIGALEESWCFAIGLAFYPGYNAKSATVADRCWMPLVPVANNGTFLADTNRTF